MRYAGLVRIIFFLCVSGLAHFLAARWLLSTFARPVSARRRRLVYGIGAGLTVLFAGLRLVASVRDTATALKISEASVKVSVHRGLKALAAKLRITS